MCVIVKLFKFYLNYIYVHICNTRKIIPAFSYEPINFYVVFRFSVPNRARFAISCKSLPLLKKKMTAT